MAQYEATVRVLDVAEADAATARRMIEERLRGAGFSRWQIVHLGLQGAMTRSGRRSRQMALQTGTSPPGGGLLVAAVVGWALWFLWLLAG